MLSVRTGWSRFEIAGLTLSEVQAVMEELAVLDDNAEMRAIEAQHSPNRIKERHDEREARKRSTAESLESLWLFSNGNDPVKVRAWNRRKGVLSAIREIRANA